MQKEKYKGITLVALVVTIIIMIILATISINMSIGDNGIVTRSVNAKRDEELQKAHDEVQSGIKRYEYYDNPSSDMGINIKLMSSKSLMAFREKFGSYINGKVAYVGNHNDKLVIVHSNDRGIYTSFVDSQGNVTTKSGVVVPKDSRINLDNVEVGTYDIGLDEDDSKDVVIEVDDAYKDYISTSFGIININKELPTNVKVTVYKGNDKWGEINLNPNSPVLAEATDGNDGDSLKPTSYFNEDGSVNTSKFKEEVRLGSDNVYAGYCNEDGVWKLCVYTKGSGEGKMFSGITKKEENFRRISFADPSIYSKIQQIDILDGVTTVTRAAFWNFFDAKTVTVGKDVLEFYALFYKPDDLYDIYPEYLNSAMDEERVSKVENLYWNVTECTIRDKTYRKINSGEIMLFSYSVGSGNFGDLNLKPNLKNLFFGSNVKVFPNHILPRTDIVEFDWPESVEIIDKYAFAGTKFKESPIPLDYTGEIREGVFEFADIEYLEFPAACTKVPDSMCRWSDVKTIKFHEGIKTIGNESFNSCKSLYNVVLPKGLVKIDKSAFENSSITTVDFHPCDMSLLTLDDYCFKSCHIQELYLPTSLLSIGKEIFSNNNSLKKVVYNCQSATKVDPSDFWYGYMGNSNLLSPIKEITIGPNVKSIPESLFCYCNKVKEINIPSNVETIGDQAFMHCSDLEKVELGTGIKSIGYRAFYGCSLISNKITIPDSCKFIDEQAFYLDDKISGLDLGNGLEEIGADAFYGVGRNANIDTVIIPESLKAIGFGAFVSFKCNKLIYKIPNGYEFTSRIKTEGDLIIPFASAEVEEIEVVDSVNTLSQYAFAGSKIKKATITTNVPKDIIKSNDVFYSCNNLTEVWYGGVNIFDEVK